MKWMSSAVVLAFVFAFSATASADVIEDCSQMSEGDACTTATGDSGTCLPDSDTGLVCVAASNGGDDVGVNDAGSSDASSLPDASGNMGGDASTGGDASMGGDTSTGGGGGSSSSDDGGCSVTSDAVPMNSLAPLFLGGVLLVVARRRRE